MKVLALVKSPLQLICAVEYFYRTDIDLKNVCFIYIKKYAFADESMSGTFKYYNIENYETTAFANSNIFYWGGKAVDVPKIKLIKGFFKIYTTSFNFFKKRRLYKTLSGFDKIVLGDPNLSIFKNIPVQLSNKQIVLLDDGLGSLKLNINYLNNNNSIISFSFLRSASEMTAGIEVLMNNFLHLRTKNEKVNNDTILFVGQPLYLASVLSFSKYIELISDFAIKNNDKTIHYWPHRWEHDLSKYNFPSNVIINREQSVLPLELKIFEFDSIPYKIVSFYSTVLITFKKIFGDLIDISSIRINSKIDSVNEVYTFIEDAKVRIIK